MNTDALAGFYRCFISSKKSLRHGLLFFIAALFLSIGSTAQNDNATQITFKIKNLGIYVKGEFTKVNVSSNFDKDNLDDSFINATLEVSSINTSNKKRDKHLLAEDYFNASKFPLIEFKSTAFKKKEPGLLLLAGDLTIKGRTKPIEFEIGLRQENTDPAIKAKLSLNRRHFGVGGNSWILSDKVLISLETILNSK